MSEPISKYELNIRKAQAISEVGKRIEWALDDITDSIHYGEQRITDELAKPEEERSDWQIQNAEAQISQLKMQKELWESLQKTLDKNLIF